LTVEFILVRLPVFVKATEDPLFSWLAGRDLIIIQTETKEMSDCYKAITCQGPEV
jgi:hypothetical protein